MEVEYSEYCYGYSTEVLSRVFGELVEVPDFRHQRLLVGGIKKTKGY